jgi:hypothetical protein
MKGLSAFHPTQDAPDTAAPIPDCSAHYFEVSGSTLAAGWYGQGLRLIDASDARNLRQVGYYYVTGTDATTNPSSLTWDTAWRGRYIYVFDMSRGIEVLKLKNGGPSDSGDWQTAEEPRASKAQARTDRLAARPVRDGSEAFVCPIFDVPGRGTT